MRRGSDVDRLMPFREATPEQTQSRVLPWGRHLEHFPPKWMPVRRRKCDKTNESRAGSDSI